MMIITDSNDQYDSYYRYTPAATHFDDTEAQVPLPEGQYMAAHGRLLLSRSDKNQIVRYLHLVLSFRHTSSPPWKKPTMLLGGGA